MSSTIKDVARVSGLSIATISKYLNGGPVRKQNKVLIDDAILSLGYRVNGAARALKTNKSGAIGVLLPDLRDSFCTAVAAQAEQALQQHGYGALVCSYNHDPDLEREKLKFLVSRSVEGLVVLPTRLAGEDVNALVRDGLPVVCVDVLIRDSLCDTILVDNLNAAYAATELLITNRHRRIGLLTGPEGFYTADERLLGYNRVHRDYFMNVDDSLVKQGDWSIESGFRQMNELLDLPDPPTAVFAANYMATMGAVMAINRLGVRVPDELSFVGFDGQELANVASPGLTIVRQPVEMIASTAAAMLLGRLGGGAGAPPELIRLKAELLARDSVADLYMRAPAARAN